MHPQDHLLVTEPSKKEVAVGTARVTYWFRFSVSGVERTFTAEASGTGAAAQAALSLTNAVLDDARSWLRAQTPTAPTTVMVKGLFGARRATVMAERVEPNEAGEAGEVRATVEIDGVAHEYTGEFATTGNPYRAAIAALRAAQKDLWDWAWDHQPR